MNNIVNGLVLDRLTVIAPLYRDKWNKYWITICRCGSEVVKTSKYLSSKTNIDKSCGCARTEWLTRRNKSNATQGGLSHSRIYKIWSQMKQRCSNKNHVYYHRYGGRGITVCERWQDFQNFLEDMGKPKEGQSLDRINNDKGYSPENCKWSTKKEQAGNRLNSRLYEFEKEQLCASEIARRITVNINTFESWLYHHNYNIEGALERFRK